MLLNILAGNESERMGLRIGRFLLEAEEVENIMLFPGASTCKSGQGRGQSWNDGDVGKRYGVKM